MSTRAKKQHYVPQLLLRGFAQPGRDQIWVFDKSRGTSYSSAIRDTASENYFNEVSIGNYSISFENRLEFVESKAAPVIRKIIETEDISNMAPEDQASLLVFIATQMVRTNAGRSAMDQAHDLLVEKLGGERSAAKAGLQPKDKELQKLTILRDLPDSINTFGKHLAAKLMILKRTGKNDRLIIGDDPIVRDNSQRSTDAFGTVGIANKGVEIYLPLTPKLAFGLICPSVLQIIEMVRTSRSTFASLEADRYLYSITTGSPFLMAPPNVLRLNSMQIANATRFVMSDVNDFSLAKRMIKDRPEIALAPKYVS